MDDLPLRYCLACGKTDITYKDIYTGTRYHVISYCSYDEFGPREDADQCFGPFATCPPPITDESYWTWLFSQPEQDEPDPIEIILSDFVGVE